MNIHFDGLDRHFALPEVSHDVPLLRAFEWLGRGWDDLRSNPLASLGHGLIIALILAAVLTAGGDKPYFLTAAVSGFLLIAPLLAIGLYEISRRRDAGETANFAESFSGWRRNSASVGLFGIALAIVAIGWERISAILFALLYGGSAPDLERFITDVFLSGDYPNFLTGYVVLGAILAALVFSVAAVSLPMMMDRGTDVVTAMMTSFKAVAMNPAPMALWAATIVVLVVAGFATLLVGMVFVLPLLGHATWHAYKELVH